MSVASHPNSTMGTKRSCDQCRRRKTRCISSQGNTCHKCSIYRLQCTFSDPIAKRGPKAHRGKIISELRSQQASRQSPTASQTSSSADEDYDFDFSSPDNDSPQLLPAQGLQYPVTALYPTPAHLADHEVAAVTEKQYRDTENGCLSFALGVYTLMAGSGHHLDSNDKSSSDADLGRELLHDLSSLRSGVLNIDRPTIATVGISLLMFHCHSALDNPRSAWFYLRQATTFALTMGLDESKQNDDFFDRETTCGDLLYCILFITERNDSLQRQCSVTLPTPSTRHMLSLEYTRRSLVTFSNLDRLVRLYAPFDEVFTQRWTGCTIIDPSAERLAHLQDEIQAISLTRRSEYSDASTVDFTCTKYWLKILVWQIALKHGKLSSTAKDISLAFVFPVRVANELLGHLDAFPVDVMQVHGSRLTSKLFEIACALLDVLMCVPIQHISPEGAPYSYLERLMTIIAALPQGSGRFNALLQSKLSESTTWHSPEDNG